jgi:hypothetical protein
VSEKRVYQSSAYKECRNNPDTEEAYQLILLLLAFCRRWNISKVIDKVVEKTPTQ